MLRSLLACVAAGLLLVLAALLTLAVTVVLLALPLWAVARSRWWRG